MELPGILLIKVDWKLSGYKLLPIVNLLKHAIVILYFRLIILELQVSLIPCYMEDI